MAETDLDKFISNDFSSLDGDDSWLPEFTTADAEAMYNDEDQCNDVEEANPKKKRKTEILGVLKGYADELQKKRKVTSSADDDSSVSTLDADNTKKRMEIFDPIMEAFNTGDFDLMSGIMKENCRHDCEFKAAYIKPGLKGAVPLMVFFGLLHEAYPDAMVKILDRRISSTKKPLSKLFDSAADEVVQRVDYVYKIVGTRISTRPLPSVYNKLIDGLMTKENLTQDEISCAISGLLTANNSACSDGECSYIVETGLSFDQNNKIIEWTYEILAFDVR